MCPTKNIYFSILTPAVKQLKDVKILFVEDLISFLTSKISFTMFTKLMCSASLVLGTIHAQKILKILQSYFKQWTIA